MDGGELKIESYLAQKERWPESGRHILAQFDDESIIVYQAYRPEIGRFAADNGYFGGAFKYSRMSWIKPNFLWMMYRSGWAEKPDQEVILAVRLPREFFDEILAAAVPSTFGQGNYPSEPEWKAALRDSDVRLQWDPDHGPRGHKEERRAVQLGLRREMLRRYGRTDLISITDVTDFVREQRQHALKRDLSALQTPVEKVYTPSTGWDYPQLRLAALPPSSPSPSAP